MGLFTNPIPADPAPPKAQEEVSQDPASPPDPPTDKFINLLDVSLYYKPKASEVLGVVTCDLASFLVNRRISC